MAKYSTFKYGDGTDYGLSANPTGNVTWIMQVDWDGDGVLDGTNEAQYMTDLTIERGERHYITRSGNFEVPAEGTFSAIMDNSNGRYNPYNASSPIYPNVKPGRLCIIDVKDNDNNITYRRFTGYILDIRPDSNADTVRIEGVDGWGRLKGAKVSVQNAFINRPLSECITSMLFAARVPAGSWRIETDAQPVRVFYVEQDDAGRVLNDLAQAGLGWFFFDRYNRPTFYARNTTSPSTHVTDQAQVLREIFSSQPWDLIGNYITVVAHRIVKERISTIWSLADPIYIANGGSATVTARYDAAVDFSADYDAWTNINGTGTQLKANFAVVLVGAAGTSQTTFTITNNSGSNGYLTELTIYGRKLADRPLDYVTEDATSQALFGTRYFLHDTPYLQSRNHASAYSGIIEAFLDDIQRELTIRIEQRPDYQFPPDLRDYIDFTSTHLGIDATFSVLGMRDEWQRDTGQSVVTTMYLSPVIWNDDEIIAEPPDEETPIPEVPPDPDDPGDDPGGGDGGGGEEVPPLPGEAIAAVASRSDVYVTENIGEDDPTWVSKTFSGTTVVDFDISLDRNNAIAISTSKIYKCSDFLTVAPSTWTEVFDAATEMTGGTGGQVLRVHWSPIVPNTVFVLAACEGASADVSDAYMLISTDAGETWTQNLIKQSAGNREPLTLNTQNWTLTKPGAGRVNGYSTHPRKGDDVSPTYNPHAIAATWTRTGDIEVGWELRESVGMTPPESAFINRFQTSGVAPPDRPLVHRESSLTAGEVTILEDFLTETFGGAEGVGWDYDTSGITRNFDTNEERVRVGHTAGDGTGSAFITDYVFWGVADPGIPACMDVANNGTWLYVGFEDSIYKSEDGGVNWFQVLASTYFVNGGAYDLHVDPQLAGVIYYWNAEGFLSYLSAGTPGVLGLTEAPDKTPLRIAKAQNYGAIWALTEGDIQKRELGNWSVQDTYTPAGRSLRTYTGGTGQRLIFVDYSTVQLSNDAGATWADKTGNITDAELVTAHLME